MNRLLLMPLLFGLLLCTACQQKMKPVFLQVAEVQLSQPLISVDSVFFYESATVWIAEPAANSQVRVAQGGGAFSSTSSIAEKAIILTESTQLRFRSSGNNFQVSEEVELEVFKLTPKDVSIIRASEAKAPYNEAAPSILLDQHKASKDFRKGDWLGYQEAVVTFELTLAAAPVTGLILSFLEDQQSWIFGPASIAARFYDGAGELIAEETVSYDAERAKTDSRLRFLHVDTDEITAAKIILMVKNLPTIPDWHPGKGHNPWLFVDEIIIR